MTRRSWTNRDGDDEHIETPSLPEPDYTDPRPAYTHGAAVWGDAPRRSLKAVEEVLDGVLGRFAGSPRSALEQIAAAWEGIAGPAWEGTRPVRITGAALVVEVPSGIVASRLQFDTARVVGELRGFAGGTLRAVRFSVARGKTSPSPKGP